MYPGGLTQRLNNSFAPGFIVDRRMTRPISRVGVFRFNVHFVDIINDRIVSDKPNYGWSGLLARLDTNETDSKMALTKDIR